MPPWNRTWNIWVSTQTKLKSNGEKKVLHDFVSHIFMFLSVPLCLLLQLENCYFWYISHDINFCSLYVFIITYVFKISFVDKKNCSWSLHSTRDGLKFVPFFPSISYLHPKEITYLIDFSFCLLIFRKIWSQKFRKLFFEEK